MHVLRCQLNGVTRELVRERFGGGRPVCVPARAWRREGVAVVHPALFAAAVGALIHRGESTVRGRVWKRTVLNDDVCSLLMLFVVLRMCSDEDLEFMMGEQRVQNFVHQLLTSFVPRGTPLPRVVTRASEHRASVTRASRVALHVTCACTCACTCVRGRLPLVHYVCTCGGPSP